MDNHTGFWPTIDPGTPTAKFCDVNVAEPQYPNLSQFHEAEWPDFLNSSERVQPVTSHPGGSNNMAEFVDPVFGTSSSIDNYRHVPFPPCLPTTDLSSAFSARNPGMVSQQQFSQWLHPSSPAMDFKPTHDQLRLWSPDPAKGNRMDRRSLGIYTNPSAPGSLDATLDMLPNSRLDQRWLPDQRAEFLPYSNNAVQRPSGNEDVLPQTEGESINNAEPSDPCYAQLLYRCLQEVPGNTLSLREIYGWVTENSQKGKDPNNRGWQNSVRHNLSMNAAFQRVSHGAKAKGSLWRLTSEALREGGVISTTRYRKDPKRKSERRLVPAPNRQRSGARGGQATRATRRREAQQHTPAVPSAPNLPTSHPPHRGLEVGHPAASKPYVAHTGSSPASPPPAPTTASAPPPPSSPLLPLQPPPPTHVFPLAPMISPYLLNIHSPHPLAFPTSTPQTPPAPFPVPYVHERAPSAKPCLRTPPASEMTNFDFLGLEYGVEPSSFLNFGFDAEPRGNENGVAGGGDGRGGGGAGGTMPTLPPMPTVPTMQTMPSIPTMQTMPSMPSMPTTTWYGPGTPSLLTDASYYTDDGVPALESSTTSPEGMGFL